MKGDIPDQTAFIGALSLDGTIQKVEGMLPVLIAAKALNFKQIYFPYDPAIPLKMIEDSLNCIVVKHVEDVVRHLHGQQIIPFFLSRTECNDFHLFDEVF
jgi:magnesium chelatase family protein